MSNKTIRDFKRQKFPKTAQSNETEVLFQEDSESEEISSLTHKRKRIISSNDVYPVITNNKIDTNEQIEEDTEMVENCIITEYIAGDKSENVAENDTDNLIEPEYITENNNTPLEDDESSIDEFFNVEFEDIDEYGNLILVNNNENVVAADSNISDFTSLTVTNENLIAADSNNNDLTCPTDTNESSIESSINLMLADNQNMTLVSESNSLKVINAMHVTTNVESNITEDNSDGIVNEFNSNEVNQIPPNQQMKDENNSYDNTLTSTENENPLMCLIKKIDATVNNEVIETDIQVRNNEKDINNEDFVLVKNNDNNINTSSHVMNEDSQLSDHNEHDNAFVSKTLRAMEDYNYDSEFDLEDNISIDVNEPQDETEDEYHHMHVLMGMDEIDFSDEDEISSIQSESMDTDNVSYVETIPINEIERINDVSVENDVENINEASLNNEPKAIIDEKEIINSETSQDPSKSIAEVIREIFDRTGERVMADVNQFIETELKKGVILDSNPIPTWKDEELLFKSQNTNTQTDYINQLTSNEAFVLHPKIRMWWYDAYDCKQGKIYLFGKVFNQTIQSYVSCCLIVENIEREVYVLPRRYEANAKGLSTDQNVIVSAVKTELQAKLSDKGITDYSFSTLNKKLALNIDTVPKSADFVKLNYSYKDYQFPKDTSGSTFSHMFGTTIGPLENFLVGNNIMGPCWIEFSGFSQPRNLESWCSLEYVIEDPRNCHVVESAEGMPHPPPLNLLAVNIQTRMDSNRETEIIAISGFNCQNVNIIEQESATSSPYQCFSIVRPLNGTKIPDERMNSTGCSIYQEDTEEKMLAGFIGEIRKCDADIIIGHEISTLGLGFLLRRLKKYNISDWSKIGRRRKVDWPYLQQESKGLNKCSFEEKLTMCGRLVCDTFVASEDLVKSKSYDLTELALSKLGKKRDDSDPLIKYQQNVDGTLEIELARYGAYDAYLILSLAVELKILPLSLQLTNLSGNLWARSMYGARSERNEYLLLHAFYNAGYICPDKPDWKNKKRGPSFIDSSLELQDDQNEKSAENSTSYMGGLVLEPKAGLYDNYVLLLDFNSLYPSIMQEYNVCFTTMNDNSLNSENYNSLEIPSVPVPGQEEGILPQLVRVFVNRRKEVKKLMENPSISKNTKSQYNIEQMALKLTANSMYGCLGSPSSRFYARSLAMFITAKGREILQATIDTSKQLGINVIYGDTDSIMIDTNTDNRFIAQDIGERLKNEINQKYKLVEIGIDGMFSQTLLLKKKKYAVLSINFPPEFIILEKRVEAKGLDLVRRDWCDLSHDISEKVLEFVLNKKDVSYICNYLKDMNSKIRKEEFNVKKFIIRNRLNKPLEEYSQEKDLPHIKVAKDMRESGKHVVVSSIIPYVMAKTETVNSGTIKPCMPEDIVNGRFKIDIDWYICHQILRPILRIVKPIDGYDLGSLSECFDYNEEQVLSSVRKVPEGFNGN